MWYIRRCLFGKAETPNLKCNKESFVHTCTFVQLTVSISYKMKNNNKQKTIWRNYPKEKEFLFERKNRKTSLSFMCYFAKHIQASICSKDKLFKSCSNNFSHTYASFNDTIVLEYIVCLFCVFAWFRFFSIKLNFIVLFTIYCTN